MTTESGGLGFHLPGRPIHMGRDPQGEALRRWVHYHEMAHATLTESSTLGLAALLCGLPSAGGTGAAGRYLTAYLRACDEVHEASATACALAYERQFSRGQVPFTPSAEVADLLPRLSMVLGHRLLSWADAAVALPELAAWSQTEEGARHDARLRAAREYLAAAATLACGIAVLSPPVPDAFFGAALRGDAVAAEPFAHVQRRRARVRGLPPEALHDTVRRLLALLLGAGREDREGGTADRVRIPAKFELASAVAAAADLPFAEPPAVGELLARHLPDIAPRAEIVRPLDLSAPARRLHFHMQHPVRVRPARVRYDHLPPRADAAAGTAVPGDAALVVPEALPAGNGWLMALHLFSAEAAHLRSYVIPVNTPVDEEWAAGLLKSLPRPAGDAARDGASAPEGVVIADSHAAPPPALLMPEGGAFTCRFSTRGVEVANRRALCAEDGIALFRLDTRGGQHLWEYGVCPPAPVPAATPQQRAYLWVLRNGLLATEAWQRHGMEHSPDEPRNDGARDRDPRDDHDA